MLPNPLAAALGHIGATFLSPWYDYMTQPAIPNDYVYTTTMQGPNYFWGVLTDRGCNFEICHDDVIQGNIGDCDVGAAVIALAEAGFFHHNLPVSIAQGAPKPYFDVKLYAAAGSPAIQHIDDMLPWSDVAPLYGFLGYQPSPDSLGTPAGLYSANAVLSVPYIEKALAKLADKLPWLKLDMWVPGYAGLAGIGADTVLMTLRGIDSTVVTRLGNPAWISEVDYCMQNSDIPCVFGTADTVERLPLVGDTYDAATQTVSWNDGCTMQFANKNGNDLLIYTPTGGDAVAFVVAHAYGMMRNGRTNSTHATLGNPWHVNPAANGDIIYDPSITVPKLTLERVMLEMTR